MFLQTVARHGSRSQTSDESEKQALAVWTAASKKGELTSTGQKFDDDLKKFQAAEKTIGYGKLSTSGHEEWVGIGRRTAANYRSFLTKAADEQDDIDFETTTFAAPSRARTRCATVSSPRFLASTSRSAKRSTA